jgi:hypothetical protein
MRAASTGSVVFMPNLDRAGDAPSPPGDRHGGAPDLGAPHREMARALRPAAIGAVKMRGAAESRTVTPQGAT